MHFIIKISKYNLFVHLQIIFFHMNVVCPGIKLIPLIYQHIAISVCFYTQFIFVFALTLYIFAHERSLGLVLSRYT